MKKVKFSYSTDNITDKCKYKSYDIHNIFNNLIIKNEENTTNDFKILLNFYDITKIIKPKHFMLKDCENYTFEYGGNDVLKITFEPFKHFKEIDINIKSLINEIFDYNFNKINIYDDYLNCIDCDVNFINKIKYVLIKYHIGYESIIQYNEEIKYYINKSIKENPKLNIITDSKFIIDKPIEISEEEEKCILKFIKEHEFKIDINKLSLRLITFYYLNEFYDNFLN